MKFNPWTITIQADTAADSSVAAKQTLDILRALPANLKIYCSYIPKLPVSQFASRFFFNIRIDELEDVDTISQNITLYVYWDYKKDGLVKTRSLLKKFKSSHQNAVVLCINKCTANFFLAENANISLFEFSPQILITDNFSDAHHHANYASLPAHLSRRRPCRYAFDGITLNCYGEVLPCPYYQGECLTFFKSVDELSRDRSYLLFLAAQLVADFEDYPECELCNYWLDGWLAEEKKTTIEHGVEFDLLFEGYGCIISIKDGMMI